MMVLSKCMLGGGRARGVNAQQYVGSIPGGKQNFIITRQIQQSIEHRTDNGTEELRNITVRVLSSLSRTFEGAMHARSDVLVFLLVEAAQGKQHSTGMWNREILGLQRWGTLAKSRVRRTRQGVA
eukprot:1042249-Pyramimonas_sp.AAC.1